MPWLDAAWQAPCWFEDGTLPFDVADRGLLLGDGVFDTSLVRDGRMVWRMAHVNRLIAACDGLGFALDRTRLEGAIDAVLERMSNASLRITVTRGPGPRGLAPAIDPHPTILVTPAPFRAAALFAPLRLNVSTIRRNETSPLSRMKSLNYGDAVLAVAAAQRSGCDDALFLNTQGHIACSSVGNVVAVIGSRLVTPPLSDGVVDGTARGMLMGAAGRLGLVAEERSMSLPDLDDADAVVCTNSLRLVSPVTAIVGRPFAEGRSAPLFQRLIHVMAELLEIDVGVDLRRLPG